jgi:tetratricopeptide (TPR) repeat protein
VGSVLLTALLASACGPTPITTLRKSGDFNFKYGNYEAAAKDFGQIVDRAPGDWEAQFRYGQSMMQLGDLQAAKRSLEIAQIAVPNNDEVAFALAECYFRLGDQTRLYQLLRDRAQSNASMESWLLMSEYALKLDDVDTARTAAINAIEVNQSNAEAGLSVLSASPYFQAALVAQRVGQREEALRRLRQGYGINPQDTRIKSMLVELGEVPGPTLALPPGA